VLKKHKDKLEGQEWAVFSSSQEDQRLVILKEDQPLTSGGVYYIIFNSSVQLVSKKLQKKIKKEYDVSIKRTPSGRPVYTSVNHPIKVDFIPDEELYMSSVGRLGLCMAPGRTKKKPQHDWARDLSKDLDRIREHYKCDVLVTLVRFPELRAIHTPNLFDETEIRGMDSIHFPIKDKYIPSSMEQFMVLIDTIIEKLKEGKCVVVHCNGGKGRSGTVLVATLVAMGRKVQQAIEVVRKARSGTIQNPLQIAYVKNFKSAWRKNKTKLLKEQEKRNERKGHQEDDKDGDEDSLPPEELDANDQEKKGVIYTHRNKTYIPEEPVKDIFFGVPGSVPIQNQSQTNPQGIQSSSISSSSQPSSDPYFRKKEKESSKGFFFMKGGQKLTENQKKMMRQKKKETKKRQQAEKSKSKKDKKLIQSQTNPVRISSTDYDGTFETIEPIEIPVDDEYSDSDEIAIRNTVPAEKPKFNEGGDDSIDEGEESEEDSE
jgi:protein-tyrosine phosphatase